MPTSKNEEEIDSQSETLPKCEKCNKNKGRIMYENRLVCTACFISFHESIGY